MPSVTKTVQTHPGKPVLKLRPAAPAPSAQTVSLDVPKKDNTPGKALVQEGNKGDVQKLAPEIKKLEKELEKSKIENVELQKKLAATIEHYQGEKWRLTEYPMSDVDLIWATYEDTVIAPDDWRTPYHNTFILLHPFDILTDKNGNVTETIARTDLPPQKCITMIPSSKMPKEPRETEADLCNWRAKGFLAIWDITKMIYARGEDGKILRDENSPDGIVAGVRGVPGYIPRSLFDQIIPVYEEAPIEAVPETIAEPVPVATTEAPKGDSIGIGGLMLPQKKLKNR